MLMNPSGTVCWPSSGKLPWSVSASSQCLHWAFHPRSREKKHSSRYKLSLGSAGTDGIIGTNYREDNPFSSHTVSRPREYEMAVRHFGYDFARRGGHLSLEGAISQGSPAIQGGYSTRPPIIRCAWPGSTSSMVLTVRIGVVTQPTRSKHASDPPVLSEDPTRIMIESR